MKYNKNFQNANHSPTSRNQDGAFIIELRTARDVYWATKSHLHPRGLTKQPN